MSDPFKHVAAGQKLVIPAATWNHVLDSARSFRSRRLGPSGGIPHGVDGYPASDVVLIKNVTGSTRPAGSVLRITGIINSPVDVPFETRALPVFTGDTPTGPSDAVAVTLVPIAADAIGAAVVDGIAVVDVNVQASGQAFAVPAVTADHLDTAAEGPIRILWRESGSSGIRKSVCQIGPINPSGAFPARITGTGGVPNTNPTYSFAEVYWTGSTWSPLTGGRTGTCRAVWGKDAYGTDGIDYSVDATLFCGLVFWQADGYYFMPGAPAGMQTISGAATDRGTPGWISATPPNIDQYMGSGRKIFTHGVYVNFKGASSGNIVPFQVFDNNSGAIIQCTHSGGTVSFIVNCDILLGSGKKIVVGAANGVTGTGGGGDTFTGGVCTALGSGGGGGGVDSGDSTNINGYLKGNGSTISGVATIPIADGGTGQTTANAALNALLPSQSSANGKFLKSDGADVSWSGGVVPPGAVMAWATNSAPTGWLLCYGQTVSRTTYADLYSTIGNSFGSGDGSTTFNLPDLRGRTVIGRDNMGGTSANRITASWADGLGDSGGAETHTLTTTEMPSHTHSTGQSLNAAGGGIQWFGGPFSIQTVTGSTGGGGSHNNVQPSIALNYIIKT